MKNQMVMNPMVDALGLSCGETPPVRGGPSAPNLGSAAGKPRALKSRSRPRDRSELNQPTEIRVE